MVRSELPLIEPMTLADLEAMVGIELLLELLVMLDETACRHAAAIETACREVDPDYAFTLARLVDALLAESRASLLAT